MKPHRIRMTHNLLLNYGLYRKMEIYVSYWELHPSLASSALVPHISFIISFFSEGQESWSDSVKWFWLRLSHETSVKTWSEATVIWRPAWALEDLLPRWFSHMVGVKRPQLLTNCWPEAFIPPHMNFSVSWLGHPSNMQLTSSRVSDPRETTRRKPWQLLWPGFRSHALTSIIFVQSESHRK